MIRGCGATNCKVRTRNAIERRNREVRRLTRLMGTFQDKASMNRILFAV
jgi:transposase-like protein